MPITTTVAFVGKDDDDDDDDGDNDGDDKMIKSCPSQPPLPTFLATLATFTHH